MKKIFLIAMIALLSIGAQAQIVGSKNSRISISRTHKSYEDFNSIYVGYNNMEMLEDWDEIFDNKPNIQGIKAGFQHDFSLIKRIPLYAEIGAEIHYGTYSDSDSYSNYEYSSRMNILSMNVPLNLSYKQNIGKLFIQPYAGVALRLNIVGNLKETIFDTRNDTTESISTNMFDNNDMDGYPFERFQYGLQYGINLGYNDYYLNIGCQKFSPFWESDGDEILCDCLTVGLGFNF